MADYSSLGVYGGYYGQQQAQTETSMLKALAPIQVEEAGLKVQETQLDIQQKNLDLKNANSLYQRQQAMLKMMDARASTGAAGGSAGQANSEAERQAGIMFEQADVQRVNGFYKEADETAQKASAILENNSKIQTRAFNVTAKQLGDFRNMLDGVSSKQDWDNLRAMFPVLHPDEAKMPGVAKILQMEYPGPNAVRAMSKSLDSQKDRAQTAAALAEAKSRTAAAAKDEAYTKDYLPKLEALADSRSAAIQKSGGAKVSTADITAVSKIIQNKFPNADPNQRYVLARHLAEDVNVLTGRGVAKADAQDQVMAQAMKNQYFAGIRKTRDSAGSTPQKPLALPDDADETKMKDGMYYMTPKGGLRVWDATTKQLLAPNPEAIRAQEEQSDDVPIDLDGTKDE